MPGRNVCFLEGTVTGSWRSGIVSNPRARTAVDCGEMDWGNVREETVVGNACGGKSGSHRSEKIPLSHT